MLTACWSHRARSGFVRGAQAVKGDGATAALEAEIRVEGIDSFVLSGARFGDYYRCARSLLRSRQATWERVSTCASTPQLHSVQHRLLLQQQGRDASWQAWLIRPRSLFRDSESAAPLHASQTGRWRQAATRCT